MARKKRLKKIELVSLVCRRVIGRDGQEMPHQRNWAESMAEGLRAHGIAHEIIEWRKREPRGSIIATWGWMIGKTFAASGRPTLICERGYVGDRKEWISAGWNGLNGRAERPIMNDGGKRWREHFDHPLTPWRRGGDYALIMGQVEGDAAIASINISRWYAQAGAAMRERGFDVAFRPHPERPGTTAAGLRVVGGSLEEALAGAAVAVTYNSNAGVDAALAGVPVIACDRGSMAWPVAAHGTDAEIVRPDRTAWCSQLAWTQWRKAEFSSGAAWDYLKHGLD